MPCNLRQDKRELARKHTQTHTHKRGAGIHCLLCLDLCFWEIIGLLVCLLLKDLNALLARYDCDLLLWSLLVGVVDRERWREREREREREGETDRQRKRARERQRERRRDGMRDHAQRSSQTLLCTRTFWLYLCVCPSINACIYARVHCKCTVLYASSCSGKVTHLLVYRSACTCTRVCTARIYLRIRR
jgi:hypothetical protein